MKLLYACADRADDPHLWSGIVAHCLKALREAGAEVEVFDRIPFECPLPLRLRHQLHKRLGRKVHFLQIEPAVLQRAAARIVARFSRGDYDAIFSPGTGVAVYAYLPARLPVFSYLDATKRTWIQSYFGLDTLCARSRRQVDELDRISLQHNTHTFFASTWAQTEARRDYGIPDSQSTVVPFGANLDAAPERTAVEGFIAARSRDTLRLFFLGKEWERKGGPEALALVRALRARGIATTLDVVGCNPALSPADSPLAQVHGFIDRSTPAGLNKFHALLHKCHVLVFLSTAEALGIALCEAAAFGVPAYASNVGGIPTVVRDGETGWLAPTPFRAEDAAATLAAVSADPVAYRRMALAARADFEARLNWRVAGRSLVAGIEQALARPVIHPAQ